MRTQDDAVRLRKLFEHVADKIGLVIDIVITDGSQPVGRGVGPVLEARDVMAVLRNDADAPQDLREHALFLAGRILDFDPALRGGRGYARAMDLLASGKALAAMERLINAQGRQPIKFALGDHVHEVLATQEGRVSAIDCHRIARIARLAGAPMDKGAGIDLLHKVGAHECVSLEWMGKSQVAAMAKAWEANESRYGPHIAIDQRAHVEQMLEIPYDDLMARFAAADEGPLLG